MIRRPPRSTPLYSSAASDVYKRQLRGRGQRLRDARPCLREIPGRSPRCGPKRRAWERACRRSRRLWDSRSHLSGRAPTMSPMSHTVSAEIVANVLSVDVAVGDTVGPLDSVVLLESMKMEIPVLADVTGTVVEIV